MPILDPAARSRHDLEWSPLIHRAADGDLDSFGRLYDLSSPVVYLLARMVLRDETAAEEVTLEAFEEIWRRAGEFESSRQPASTWVAKIANERALARRRLRAGAFSGEIPSGDAASQGDSRAYSLRAVYASA
jgi:RNA polymerase sigma-70 factor (ECF subfamily)